MPRPPRKQFAGALYHVTSRGNGRSRIFFDDNDFQRFLIQLRNCLEHYEVILYAYVLMPNHYHLFVRTPHPNLSRFMQRLNTSYALYSRYKHRKPGHRLEGRYHAKLVQGDCYILTLTRYLHLNPVKVQTMQKMGKGERCRYLDRYGWSSYRGYVDDRKREDFVCYDILKSLSENCRRARRRYRAYVESCLLEDDGSLRKLMEQSSHGIGDEDYVEELEQELRQRKSGTERDRDVNYPEERISADRIDEVVTKEYGTTVEALRSHGHATGAGMAKAITLELACRLTGLTQREIGTRYGGISSQAVSHARKRVKTSVPANRLIHLANVIRSKPLLS